MWGDKARAIRNLERDVARLRKQHYDLEVRMWSLARAAGVKWVPTEDGHYQKDNGE